MKKIKRKSILNRLAIATALSTTVAGSVMAFTPTISTYADETSSNQNYRMDNLEYLSDLNTVEYSSDGGNLRKNKNYENQPLVLNLNGTQKTFDKGLGTHANAKLVYDLTGKDVNVFDTYLGISRGKPGVVEYFIYLDDELVLKSGKIDQNKTQRVRVNLVGAKKLKILVDESGSRSSDHAILADAKIYKTDISQNKQDSQVKKVDFSFYNMKDSDYRLKIEQYNFVKGIGRGTLFSIMMDDPRNEEIVSKMLNNQAFLSYYNASGGAKNNNVIGFFNVLKRIVDNDETALSDPDNQRIAMAVALEYADGPMKLWINNNSISDSLKRYQIFRDLNKTPGELMPIFKTLDIELLRNVVGAEMSDADLIWLREKIKREKPGRLANNDELSGITHTYIAYNVNNRYGDSIHGSDFYGENPTIATVIDLGGVCGSISKFDTLALKAFGVPANLIGQPGHAAVVYMRDDGSWGRANNISSWGESQGGTITVLANGSGGNNTSYNVMATEVRKNPENYDLAKRYYELAEQTTDPKEKQVLWEKNLDLVPLYAPTYIKIIESYNQRKASDKEYYELAVRIVDTFRNYPKPMKDLLDRITAKFERNRYLNASFASHYLEVIDSVTDVVAKDVLKETEYTNVYKKYNNFLGTFSFSGNAANRLLRARPDTEYSLDGGITYIPIREDSPLLSIQDTNNITAKNGILLRLKGTTATIKLKFVDSPIPENVKANDQEDFIIGMTDKMEYSLDNGISWIDGSITPNLSGNKKVLIRYKRVDNNLGSAATTLNFTESSEPLSNILHSNVSITHFSSQQNDTWQAAARSIDGDMSSFWHTSWNRGDNNRTITFKFNKQYKLTNFLYTPRQDSGTNGDIKKYVISVSDDGRNFRKVKEGDISYATNSRSTKVIPFPENTMATYVKLEVPEGVGGFVSAADFTFQTTVEEAQNAKQEKDNLIQNTLKKQFDAQVKLFNREVTVAGANVINNDDLQQKAAVLRDKVNDLLKENDANRMAVELTKLRVEFNALNDQIIQDRNRKLSEMTGLGSESYEGKIDEYKREDEKKAEDFKRENNVLLDLSVDTVRKENYDDLVKAYYTINAQSAYTKEKLKEQQAHIKSLIDAIDNKSDTIEERKNKYKELHREILAQNESSINVTNVSDIQKRLVDAYVDYGYLDANVKEALSSEKQKLDEVKKAIDRLSNTVSKNKLTKYIQANRNHFAGDETYNKIWTDLLTSTQNEIQSQNDRGEEFYNQKVFELETKKAELEYNKWEFEDRLDRVNKFKKEFETLLAKDVNNITLEDKKQAEKAMYKFQKLDVLAQGMLSEQKDKLNEIYEKVLKQDSSVNVAKAKELVKKLVDALNREKDLVPEPYATSLKETHKKAKALHSSNKPVNEILDEYKKLLDEKSKILKEGLANKEKADKYRTLFSKVLKLSTGAVSVEDEQEVLKAEQEYERVAAEVGKGLDDVKSHIAALKERIAYLKDENNRQEIEKLNAEKEKARQKLDTLLNISLADRKISLDEINNAINVSAVNMAINKATKKDTDRANELRNRQNVRNQIKAVLDNFKNADILEENEEARQGIINDYSNLDEILNARTLQDRLKALNQKIEELKQKDAKDKENKERQRARQEAIEALNEKISEANEYSETVSDTNTHKEELKTLIEDARYFLIAGNNEDAIRTYIQEFENKLSEIKEEIKRENVSLEEKKTFVKGKIDALSHLTLEEKNAYKNDVERKLSESDIDLILKNAIKTNEDRKEAEKEAIHNQNKMDAISKINALSDLMNEEKSQFISRIQSSNKEDNLEPIVEEAKTLNENNRIKREKEEKQGRINAAIERVNALYNLSDVEKNNFIAQIQTTNDIESVVNNAIEKDKENKAKKDAILREHNENVVIAKQKINEFTHLTEEEKQKFINDLSSLAVGDDVNGVVEEARTLDIQKEHAANEEAARKRHEERVLKGLEELETLTHLTSAEKTAFINELTTCEVGCNINEILERAKEKDVKNLEKAEKEKHNLKIFAAKEKLAVLTYLTDEEKENFILRIENSNVNDDLDLIIEEAKALNTQNENEVRRLHEERVAEGLKEIEKLTHLTEEERASFVNELTTCEIGCNINEIVDRAKAIDSANNEKESEDNNSSNVGGESEDNNSSNVGGESEDNNSSNVDGENEDNNSSNAGEEKEDKDNSETVEDNKGTEEDKEQSTEVDNKKEDTIETKEELIEESEIASCVSTILSCKHLTEEEKTFFIKEIHSVKGKFELEQIVAKAVEIDEKRELEINAIKNEIENKKEETSNQNTVQGNILQVGNKNNIETVTIDEISIKEEPISNIVDKKEEVATVKETEDGNLKIEKTAPEDKKAEHKDNKGLLIGGTISGIGAVIAIASGVYAYKKKKNKNDD